jgi:beta-lactamase class A
MVVATPAALPPLPPPAITQPAPYQVSYGLVRGRAAAGTRWVVVSVNGRVRATSPIRKRAFSLRVPLPTGDVRVRVTTATADGRTSATVVDDVLGLPQASAPRFRRGREDAVLSRKLRALARGFRGSSGVYVQSLTGGAGAAWNAKARFPAASTLKLAIATAVLARHRGVPPRGSYVGDLLVSMLTRSDNAAANALETWLGGSTSGGSHRVNALMRSIGMKDSEMYGGYELNTYSRQIPVQVEQQPSWGYGKHTTARDLATLLRAVWLASAGLGPLARAQPGFSAEDGRHLLWVLARVQDLPKLDRVRRSSRGVVVAHKAGWVSTARHDAGLVFWPGGVFVAGVLTYDSSGVGVSADSFAGRIAATTLARLERIEG